LWGKWKFPDRGSLFACERQKPGFHGGLLEKIGEPSGNAWILFIPKTAGVPWGVNQVRKGEKRGDNAGRSRKTSSPQRFRQKQDFRSPPVANGGFKERLCGGRGGGRVVVGVAPETPSLTW